MISFLKHRIKNILGHLGYHLASADYFNNNYVKASNLKFLELMPKQFFKENIKALNLNSSQLNQDVFVLNQLQFKRNGFFVEFGATDGVTMSNSFFLEKFYGWKGIVAEPAKKYHSILRKHRNCAVETRCIWRASGEELSFQEEQGGLSTITSFANRDSHSALRISGNSYSVNTVSLADLLRQNDAPLVIDYLSIDTEGSEYEILKSFDFTTFKIGIITCEHNYGLQRVAIETLLTNNGFKKVLCELSDFDDWYVNQEIHDVIIGSERK